MRRPLACLFAVALGCDAPPLQFGPCVPERVTHVAEFGYFVSPAFMHETSRYSTMAWSEVEDVARAQESALRSIAVVQHIFDVASPHAPSAPQIESRWRAVAAELRPHADVIAALFTSDEPYWNAFRAGVPFDEVARRLEEAARIIHATPGFEDVPVATIFARPELDWIASGRARNPAGYAWVGFDQYGVSVNNLDRSTRLFLSLLRPEQRVIAVPDAMLEPSKDIAGLEERIAFWLAWIERTPKVVAIAPFIYWSGGDEDTTWTGARDLPSIRDRYAQIGKCIVDANAARTASTASATRPATTARAP
jgi:hypothetical protein